MDDPAVTPRVGNPAAREQHAGRLPIFFARWIAEASDKQEVFEPGQDQPNGCENSV